MADSRETVAAPGRTIVYCVVPAELAEQLHEPLRRHFADEPYVEVVVERRAGERRLNPERRTSRRRSKSEAVSSSEKSTGSPDVERRVVRAADGRRVADRRALALAVASAGELPRKVRPYARQLAFIERIAPTDQELEDRDTAQLVARFQAGEQEVFSELYLRHFDRVFSYLLVTLNDRHGAEDLAQQVFTNVLQALPRYERRTQPFRAWLFRIVRNQVITELQKRGRIELTEPESMTARREMAARDDDGLDALSWISDHELLMFIERLPLPQRQVLLLRFMLDLTSAQVATILDRSPEDVRTLQRRGLAFLRQRLTAVGRGPARRSSARIRRLRPQADVLRARRFSLLGSR